GAEALSLLAAGPTPDVVLLDVQMPDLDGWDTLASIRQTPRLSQLPVILCTVRSSPADAERGWSLGCDGYLGKPFTIDDLVSEAVSVSQATVEERLHIRHTKLARARREVVRPERSPS